MFTLNCKGRLLVADIPLVMGIINTTPDSFFPGSRIGQEQALLQKAGEMLAAGAAILDLGGQSTRPGATQVGEEEEASRVLPAISAIVAAFPDAVISIDTFYSSVARKAIDAGASIVNDVSAGTIDPNMIDTVASLKVPYVLMHMKGHPQTMQQNPHYEDVVLEVFDTLNHALHKCRKAGILDVIIDPGFGFGKTIEHNFQLLYSLEYFNQLGCPILVGLSRKATVYKTLSVTANEALNGTTVLHTIALVNGAGLLRVHDVKEAVEAVKLVEAVKKQKSSAQLPFIH